MIDRTYVKIIDINQKKGKCFPNHLCQITKQIRDGVFFNTECLLTNIRDWNWQVCDVTPFSVLVFFACWLLRRSVATGDSIDDVVPDGDVESASLGLHGSQVGPAVLLDIVDAH